ncbi:MAG: tyrosine-type recombinase/integrase [Iamia sp.]
MTEAMPPHLRALPLIGFGAGLRPGEILGLTVSTVEGLPPRRPGGLALVGEAGPGALVVRQQMQTVRGAPTLRPLKGAKGKRSGEHRVPVVAELVEAVRLQLAACGEGPGGLVFATPPGEPVSRGHLSREWRKAAQGAGVEGARPHDLRHSYATNLLREGVSVAAVSGWLGHRSVQTTLDTYWHAIPGDEDRGRAVVARLLGGSGVSDVPQDVPQTGA